MKCKTLPTHVKIALEVVTKPHEAAVLEILHPRESRHLQNVGDRVLALRSVDFAKATIIESTRDASTASTRGDDHTIQCCNASANRRSTIDIGVGNTGERIVKAEPSSTYDTAICKHNKVARVVIVKVLPRRGHAKRGPHYGAHLEDLSKELTVRSRNFCHFNGHV